MTTNNVLVLRSSITSEFSQTNNITDYLLEKLAGKKITQRNLAQNTLPHFDHDAYVALRRKPDVLTTEQQAMLTLSDQLINELQQNDLIVINAPMYNFHIPTQLKS